ncbi:hypothetical protein EW145_g7722 [Phellinidium pouzarii]|uniref:Uncharacterized protein n=1 Tax=Phellinidium pouzarii TaxID=167371 RepID=A0A4S4KFG5_9AGAM|nr:hypothetical protein EW145_g7722 [Phellinidium pouzarii]
MWIHAFENGERIVYLPSILKESCVDKSGMKHENQVLQKISGMADVPRIIAHEDVDRGVKDATATNRFVHDDNEYWKTNNRWRRYKKTENQEHLQMLMTPYGKPLESQKPQLSSSHPMDTNIYFII